MSDDVWAEDEELGGLAKDLSHLSHDELKQAINEISDLYQRCCDRFGIENDGRCPRID